MDIIKDLGVVAGLLVALWGLFRGIREYSLQGTQKRAEVFLKKQSEYFGNKSFNEMRYLLEQDAVELRDVNFEEKRAYLTFFEEIAILRNSRLINNDVACYMFGYYAVQCAESKNFWSNLTKDIAFWGVFLGFAGEMKARLLEDKNIISPHLRF